MEKSEKARKGEALAERYLVKTEKFKILTRNWRCLFGEVDLVAKNPSGSLVFVEVKSRYGDEEGAWQAVSLAKQKKLQRLAFAYLKAKNLPLETSLRFDVAVVDLATEEVKHAADAFWPRAEL